MKTNTRQIIADIILQQGSVTAHQLHHELTISPQMVHRHLKHLLSEGKVQKMGKPPRVYYQPVTQQISSRVELDQEILKILDKNFWMVDPTGSIRGGAEGFRYWCEKRNLPVIKTAKEYQATLQKYHTYQRDGYIDGIPKLKQTFETVWLDGMYYLDFYSIERFGKTKLGAMLLYAKQSQNQGLIKQLVELTKKPLERLASQLQIDAVGFVPHTVPRRVQLQKEFQAKVWKTYPQIELVKVNNQIPVPQKTLSKLDDRVENASKTILLVSNTSFDRVLLFDDATGSGATMNVVAQKLKQKQLAKQVHGVVIAGSYKGFEVLKEV